MDTEEAYKIGKDVALEAMNELVEQLKDYSAPCDSMALGSLMIAIMHSVYLIAPSEEAAEELISLSQKCALTDYLGNPRQPPA